MDIIQNKKSKVNKKMGHFKNTPFIQINPLHFVEVQQHFSC